MGEIITSHKYCDNTLLLRNLGSSRPHKTGKRSALLVTDRAPLPNNTRLLAMWGSCRKFRLVFPTEPEISVDSVFSLFPIPPPPDKL